MRLASLYHRVARATHGDYTGLTFCHTRLVHRVHRTNTRSRNKHKNEGWQDRLPPVLGAMCNALPLDKHGRGLDDLALVKKRSYGNRNPVEYFGDLIDQISNANIENCTRAAEIARRLQWRRKAERSLLQLVGDHVAPRTASKEWRAFHYLP